MEIIGLLIICILYPIYKWIASIFFKSAVNDKFNKMLSGENRQQINFYKLAFDKYIATNTVFFCCNKVIKYDNINNIYSYYFRLIVVYNILWSLDRFFIKSVLSRTATKKHINIVLWFYYISSIIIFFSAIFIFFLLEDIIENIFLLFVITTVITIIFSVGVLTIISFVVKKIYNQKVIVDKNNNYIG